MAAGLKGSFSEALSKLLPFSEERPQVTCDILSPGLRLIAGGRANNTARKYPVYWTSIATRPGEKRLFVLSDAARIEQSNTFRFYASAKLWQCFYERVELPIKQSLDKLEKFVKNKT